MISIIIISKNEQNYLPRLLSSIRKQDYKDYEIILADAQSTDKTREIAKQFDVKIIEGGFPSFGRNKGFNESSGDIILFLDSDVELPMGFLEENIKEFEKRKLGCATTIYIPISYFRKDKFLFWIYNWIQRTYQFFSPVAGGFCIFCKRKVFNEINGFNDEFQMCDDVDFVRRAGRVDKWRILKSVPIYCDVRRLERDGRWGTLKNYFKGFMYYNKHGMMKEAPFDYELQGGVNVKDIKKQ
jgi:glycosyltransferase involved in cell wall biosynthesis